MLVVLAWCAAHAPGTIERGPAGLLPGLLLALAAPVEGTEYDLATLSRSQPAWLNTAPPPGTFGERLRSVLYLEAWQRLQSDELGEMASRLYLGRIPFSELDALERNFPKAWPRDQPWRSNGTSSYLLQTSTVARPGWEAVYNPGSAPYIKYHARVGAKSFNLSPRPLQIDVTLHSSEFMSATGSPEIDRAVGEMLFSRVHVKGETATLRAHGRTESRRSLAPFYGVYRYTVLLGDERIGSGIGGWAGEKLIEMRTDWVAGGESRAAASPERLTVEFIGDPGEGYRAYMLDWTRPRHAWEGKVRQQPVLERGDR